MVTLPPYTFDCHAYHQLPVEDRWIFNKLQLAERLGHACGPVVATPPPGVYCLRPIMSLGGGAGGGFYKVTITAADPLLNEPHGFFWCEWFDGEHFWTQYINDVPVHASRNHMVGDVLTSVSFDLDANAIPMPDFLKGISRYMLIEAIGSNIIECSPRCMGLNARQEIIDDYKTIDPTYTGQDVATTMGNADGRLIPTTLGEQMQKPTLAGFRWDDIHNRRPW